VIGGGISVGDGHDASGPALLDLLFLLGIVKSSVINVCHLEITQTHGWLAMLMLMLSCNRSPAAVNRSVLAIGNHFPSFSLFFSFSSSPFQTLS
jgi:hypothetical protein